jgi:hypothetical protein
MDPIQAYQQAARELKTATAQAERLAKVVTQGASALRIWKTAMVSDVQVGFPAEIALNPRTLAINPADWPTAQAIAESLGGFHRAKFALQAAYNAIPGSQKDIVQPPHSFE